MPLDFSIQLHIAVCDDEAIDRRCIVDSTQEILTKEGLDCVIDAYSNGADLFAAIQKGVRFHILLLDVMMEQMDGMDLAAALRKLGNDTAIIFISSNREMAMRGYEVEAMRYLGKPINQERLREALLFCCRKQFEQKEILLPTANGDSRVSPSDIIYAEVRERGARLVLREGQMEVNLKISELESMLPARQFVLCHRSILVNLAFVQSLRYCELELKTGHFLPVSRLRQTELRKKLVRYLDD